MKNRNATMQNPLGATFARLRDEGRKALLPYFMGLWPDRETFAAFLARAEEAGADAVEVGIPFSDPLADGPAIQDAGHEVLSRGVRLQAVLQAVKEAEIGIPVLLMTYVNPVLRRGAAAFMDDAQEAGACGLIVPDLPFDQAPEIRWEAESRDLDLVPLVAPNTSEDRMPDVLGHGSGFAYLVSVTGVTGERPEARFALDDLVRRIRFRSGLPVCIGFGVSTPAQAAEAAAVADGVIVGSALIRAARSRPSDPAQAVFALLSEMRGALDGSNQNAYVETGDRLGLRGA